jgi:hypothetical protein
VCLPEALHSVSPWRTRYTVGPLTARAYLDSGGGRR